MIAILILLTSVTVNAAVTVSVNGTNHTIPQTNEKGWGNNVTAWIQAISQYTLQNSGGTFTLSADTDFGASYGLKSLYYKSRSSNLSSAGILRLAVGDTIGWRNNANGGNLLLAVDGSDRLTFNSSVVPTSTSATFQDSTFDIYDNSDNTKKVQFQVSGVTTGTTHTLTVPDASTTIVGTDATQTLTNKTLTAPVISTISNTGTLTLPTSTDTLVGRATTDTLTNKTLTSPVISTISNTGTLTLPTSTDTLVGRATTDTLTNKTIAYASNTLTGVQPTATLTTKGDIYVATASATVARQGIGVDGEVLIADSAQTNGLKWGTAPSAPDQPYEISNCTITTSVAASALTIALKDKSGSDPSGGSACKIGFRNTTASTGTYTQVSTTSAVSLTISSGSTLGCTNAVDCFVNVYAINNAGTVVLGAVNGWLDESLVQSSTAEGGAGAADSAGVLYSTAAQTSKAVRFIGKIRIQEATAGTWASNSTDVSSQPTNRIMPALFWTGYHGTDCSFARTNAAYGDPAADASCTFNSVSSKNFPTVSSHTSGGNNLPGIAFTTVSAGAYQVCANANVYGGSAGHKSTIRLVDGSSTFYSDSTMVAPANQYTQNLSVCGIAYLTAGQAVVFKLEGKNDAGTITIGDAGAASTAVDWTVKVIGN